MIERELTLQSSRTVREQMRLIQCIAFLSLPDRIVDRLAALVLRDYCSPGEQGTIDIAVTQAELASMTAVTRPALSKALQGLQLTNDVRLGFGRISVRQSLLDRANAPRSANWYSPTTLRQ